MREERRWNAALAEHEIVVREFLAVCERVTPANWHRSRAPGKWSPAAVALHVCRTYELGRDAMTGGQSMRLQISPVRAWCLRTLMLPMIFAAKRFPHGAPAPVEVVPDAAEARLLMQDAAAIRLQRVADQAAAALRRAAAERAATSFTHAYFGRLAPHATLRLLSAHTRHHARGLAHQAAVARVG